MTTTLNKWYDIEIEIKVKDKYGDEDEQELTLRALKDIERLILEAEIDYQMRGLISLSSEAKNYRNAFKELENKINEKR